MKNILIILGLAALAAGAFARGGPSSSARRDLPAASVLPARRISSAWGLRLLTLATALLLLPLGFGLANATAPSAGAEHGGPPLTPFERLTLCLETVDSAFPESAVFKDRTGIVPLGTHLNNYEVALTDFDQSALYSTGIIICAWEYHRLIGAVAFGEAFSQEFVARVSREAWTLRLGATGSFRFSQLNDQGAPVNALMVAIMGNYHIQLVGVGALPNNIEDWLDLVDGLVVPPNCYPDDHGVVPATGCF